MQNATYLLGGLAAGAGLMYALDPQAGRRRRALARDQLTHALHKAEDALDATARDLSQRATGMIVEAGNIFGNEDVPDDVLVARVREKLGHYTSHPGAIEVTASDGRATLSGPILASEAPGVRRAVAHVRGVREVDDRLEVHEQDDGIPALQGGVPRTGERFELFQERWSPTTRLLVVLASGILVLATAELLAVARNGMSERSG
jgi:hypothetical protein